MDWFGNRYSETYTYTRVSWDTWNEYESYDYITDGSLELSTSSSMKVTGSFDFEGFDLPRTDDLVRVYYSFTDSKGEYTKVPLATLFVEYSSLTYSDTLKGVKSKGTLNGQSVLLVMERDLYGPPYPVKRGENPILVAVRLIKECGLNVDYVPTGKVMNVDYTFPAGTSYLEMVNWLCDFAGYYQAYPDEYGTIQLNPISSENEADVEFVNDDRSIMYPEISDETNLNEACNIVKIGYSSETGYRWAEARNLSGSPISLNQTGGRRSVLYEEATDIEDGKNATSAIRELAQERLKEQALKVETVTFSHAYIPMNINQAVQVRYSDYDWLGYVNNMSISLKPAIKTQTKIQKEEQYDIMMSISSGVTEVEDNG